MRYRLNRLKQRSLPCWCHSSQRVGTSFRGALWCCTCCVLLLAGCTKEIDIALKKVSPKLVIEAVVANGQQQPYVRLSYTRDFSDQQAFDFIEDAWVVLSDSTSKVHDTLQSQLDERGLPYFPSFKVRARIGHVYQLTVKVDERLYTARSVMPDTVSFNGISLLSGVGKLDEESVFSAVPKFVDRAGVRNYYRFEQYVNGEKDPGINVLNDNVGDGLVNERPIFTKDIDIHLGDTLKITMIQINQDIYQYFYQLQQNQQDLGATPSNPQTNIISADPRYQQEVLGYFSAEYRQYFTAVIVD